MRVLVPVADGVEDIETVTLIDVLRRAELQVDVASLGSQRTITAARGCRLEADQSLAACTGDYALIALPGGVAGAQNFAACEPLIARLRAQRAGQGWYAAICASPALVLAAHGLLVGVRATCYPSFREQLGDYVDEAVVVAGRCITSQGPGTALPFALTLVEVLCGAARRAELSSQMLA